MKIMVAVVVATPLASSAIAAEVQFVRSPDGKVVSINARAMPGLDSANARPMPMPMPMVRMPLPSHIDMVIGAAKARPAGKIMVFPGGEASEAFKPVSRGPAEAAPRDTGAIRQTRGAEPQQQSAGDGVGSQEYGASKQVYTTSPAFGSQAEVFRKAGLITLNGNGGESSCNGALIKKGIVVTAARCIYNWAAGGGYGGWKYYPGARYGSTAFPRAGGDGWPTYDTLSAYIPDAYFDGHINCAGTGTAACDCNHGQTGQDDGVVCYDDIGLLAIKPDSQGKFPGDKTGWFGFAINSYGYKSGQAQITQLGYSGPIDSGGLMERTDSRGYVTPSLYNNTIIGSLLTVGASGGPWLVNFGKPPVLDASVTQGTAAVSSVVVGVTSWAYTCNCGATSLKQNGASPFLSSNISTLVDRACSDHPEAC